MLDLLKGNYYFEDDQVDTDTISGEKPYKLKYCVGGQWLISKTDKYMPCYNPSTGEVIAHAPQCTSNEMESAVQAARAAFPGWSDTPVSKRVQVLYNMKHLVDKHLDELTFSTIRSLSDKRIKILLGNAFLAA